MTLIKLFWTRYFDFEGRSSRSDYWLVVLLHIIGAILFAFLILIFDKSEGQNAILLMTASFFGFLYACVSFVPNLSLTIRRLRDADYHWAFIFLAFAPFGSLVLLFLLAQPTKAKIEE